MDEYEKVVGEHRQFEIVFLASDDEGDSDYFFRRDIGGPAHFVSDLYLCESEADAREDAIKRIDRLFPVE
jgi:hypothetical protein